MIEWRAISDVTCPDCGGVIEFRRSGQRGIRFRCKPCGKQLAGSGWLAQMIYVEGFRRAWKRNVTRSLSQLQRRIRQKYYTPYSDPYAEVGVRGWQIGPRPSLDYYDNARGMMRA